MKRWNASVWGRSAGIAVIFMLWVAALGLVSGCDHKPTDAENQAAAKAFKGGAMTKDDRAGMMKDVADAAAYRKAHPAEFPTPQFRK